MPAPTPFHPRTAALCRSYAWKDWAGFVAARSYAESHEPEYHALRHAAGLIDVSPLFKYEVTGSGAGEFLSYVFARDVSRMKVGRVVYACLCDTDGNLVDDGTVARLEPNRYRVTTASPSLHWLLLHARGFDVKVRDVSEGLAALAVQGPTSRALVSEGTDRSIEALRYFGIAAHRIAGQEVEISRTGYTGDLGYEIWVPAEGALAVWDALLEAGTAHAATPAGLDALDMTRVEAGFILQDVDYFSALRSPIPSRKSSPFEMGLGGVVQLERDAFLGQAALRAEKARGSPWAFVGLEIQWEAVEALYAAMGLPPHLPTRAWRDPVPVVEGSRQVGQATSGTWSPLLKRNLALASVERDVSKPGTRLQIEHTVEFRRHFVPATVVERPFFDPERKKAR